MREALIIKMKLKKLYYLYFIDKIHENAKRLQILDDKNFKTHFVSLYLQSLPYLYNKLLYSSVHAWFLNFMYVVKLAT